MRYSTYMAVICAFLLLYGSNAFAGEKERTVIAACAATAKDGISLAACIAGGLTGNEIVVCLKTPNKCFGENNEFRKVLCMVKVGCKSQPYVNDLKRVIFYRDGCIALFKSGAYLSPDCLNLAGGGKTVNA